MKKSHGCIIVLLVPVVLVALLVCLGVAWYVSSRPEPEKPVNLEGYVPSGEFSEAYNALQNRKPKADPNPNAVNKGVDPGPDGYNLEKTMQTFRSIELAQKQSGDWMSFLTFLAKQDYEGVPAEVTSAQSRILPIMERLRDIEKEIGDNSGTMMALNCIASGALAAVDKVDMSTLVALTASTGGFGVLLKAPEALNACSAGLNAALDSYKSGKMKRDTLERKLHEVQMAYVEYLSKLVPIRRKYEKEWDALCLEKDKAYLQTGRSQYAEALVSTGDIMKKYPYDREAILLRSLSLVRQALAECQRRSPSRPKTRAVELKPVVAVQVPPNDAMVVEAGNLLDKYIHSYPDSTGPALVLKGLVECATGDVVHAAVSFDQSAIEYPRQAEKLANMLEVYASRPHLEMTAEGQYLLRLHRSLCEGFGPFSPNLEKAFAYERECHYDKAREEIYNHFFRRGNQVVFHELFTDMEFCEKYLTVGFKGLLMEHAFFDLEVKNAGWTDSSDKVKVVLKSRTDFELKNVRVFLCVQFTEMYINEFDVLKVGSVGKLAAGDSYEFPELPLARENKTYRDISRVRAIVMADDRICWVDPVDEKQKHAHAVATGSIKVDLPFTPEEYLSAFGTDSAKLAMMAGEIPVSAEKRMMVVDELELSLPRVFAVLDPVFTVGEIGGKGCVFPQDKIVAGGKIVLRFPVSVKLNETVDFCIYSDYSSFKVQLKRKDDKTVVVDKVELIEPLRST